MRSGLITFVESNLPPNPVSIMATSTLCSLKWLKAIAGVTSKNVESILRELSLWDKKESKLRELSGGMKRRVLIAKALSHEPKILFLDEPTASVDVELRKDMWKIIKRLKSKGVTIILTTHYL